MIMGPKNWSYEEKLIEQITSRKNQNLLGNKIGRNKYSEPYIKKKKNLKKELNNQTSEAKLFYAKG